MNSVTVDAMHYERLVRDSVKYEQLRVLMIKSVKFSKWFDRIQLDDETVMDGISAIFSSSEFNDIKSRYEYLKQKYKDEEARKEAEAKKTQEGQDEHCIE